MSAKSQIARKKRQRRVRTKISGTSTRPRLNVYRSLKHIYAQVIDDTIGHTLVAASSIEDEFGSGKKSKSEQAAEVGKVIAGRALGAGIDEVVFDRAGYLYHGRVKALAEAARASGLKF